MTPLTVVYFLIATPVSIEEVSTAATIAGLFALPFGLFSGVIVDKIGVRSSLVLNNLLAAFASGIYLVVDNFVILLFGQVIMAISSRIYWSSWSPYVYSLSGVHGFSKTFGKLEAIKAWAMGSGALISTGVLLMPGVASAKSIVLFNMVTSLLAALIYSRIRLVKSEVDVPPSPLSGLKNFKVVFSDRRNLLICVGAFFLSPLMLLPNISFSVLFVEKLGLVASVASILFFFNTFTVALLQTRIDRLVSNIDGGRLLMTIPIIVTVTLIPLIFLAEVQQYWYWLYAIFVGIMLGIVDIVYMPVSNKIMVTVPEKSVQGSAMGIYQTMSGVGMATFPLLTPMLVNGMSTSYWFVLIAFITIGSIAYRTVSPRRNSNNVAEV